MDKTTGTIARLMDKGYGFISVEGQEKDLFFHMKNLQGAMFDDLQEGDTVTFDVEDGPKGPSAINVERAGSAAPAADMGASDDDDAPAEEE